MDAAPGPTAGPDARDGARGTRRRPVMRLRVAIYFMFLSSVLCAASLTIPGYLRPGVWTAAFVGIMITFLVLAVLVRFTGDGLAGLVMPIVLISDGAIVLAVACLEDRRSARLVAVLLVLPTLYLGMFLDRRALLVQSAVVAACSVAIMVLAGDAPVPLMMRCVIVVVAAISPAYAVLQLREGLARAVAAKHRLALIDPLTSLANRRGLDEQAPAVVLDARRRGTRVAVLVADLDHFKRVNDTWGHRAGDEVLAIFAHAVTACVAPEDLVVRLGGEEIVVIAAVSSDTAAAMAERIRSQVSQRLSPWRTTVSVGVAWADPAETLPGETDPSKADLSKADLSKADPENLVWRLVGDADGRLYAAKAAGRNRVVLPV